MKKMLLTDFLASGGTQREVADALGTQQSAISQMVRARRTVELTICDGKIVSAIEFRPIPARPKRSAA